MFHSSQEIICFVWFGLVWFGLVWFGLVWFGSVEWAEAVQAQECDQEQVIGQKDCKY